MDYRRFKDVIYLRLNPGEEIIEKLTEVIEKEHISLGSVKGIGATDKFTVGLYSLKDKKYMSSTYEGEFEIVSLLGNITQKDGKPYIHLHIGCADKNNDMKGGHLNYCRISATCEIQIFLSKGVVEREVDKITGLNIFSFR